MKNFMSVKRLFLGLSLLTNLFGASQMVAMETNPVAHISLKTPGNAAVTHALSFKNSGNGKDIAVSSEILPVEIERSVAGDNHRKSVSVVIKAKEDIYFNYGEQIVTDYPHESSLFLMPGFWYRKNLRSPEHTPSIRESEYWLVREDRLSTPLTAVFSPEAKKYMAVMRTDKLDKDALTTHNAGEVIVSGETSIGYTGFGNADGKSYLAFGFPYCEAPKSYIRKLTLAPSVEAFQLLRKGNSIHLNWELTEKDASDFSECMESTWNYCYDITRPQPVEGSYSPEQLKRTMTDFFTASYVDDKPLKYYAGVGLETATCTTSGVAEVGFLGRSLLNAYNALEYGELNSRNDLIDGANKIYESYLNNGFSPAGIFREVVRYNPEREDSVRSIRRQSEAVYAVLNYLQYEKLHGRKHPEWEAKMKNLLNIFLDLQNPDGSFPRKFKDDGTIVDETGGSTPSATLPLVMGYKYFKNKRYLEAARRSVDYLENELISKSDYFSSTLDANCEDKEASLYAATATYYLALVTKGEEQRRCAELTKKAAYFALSWYYTWDVPFAKGQMLGDIGLKTRGWGNVSVENNHIDVFVFEFADVLRWLGREYADNRFTDFAEVISSSMGQLLPVDGHLCGIAKTGYYPEVVQHTNWDYGRNGKGYYNNIFAPGWTVASLWQLYTPGRAEEFLLGKK